MKIMKKYPVILHATALHVFMLIVPFFLMPIQEIRGQAVEEEYTPREGLLRIGPEPERAIELTDKGYTLVLPGQSADVKGVVLFLDGWRVKTDLYLNSETSFERIALQKGLAILRITTGNPLDFYFDDSVMSDVASMVEAVLLKHQLKSAPLFPVGMSLGGTRALKLSIYLLADGGEHWLKPGGTAIVDSPLDMVRFYGEEMRAASLGFHPAAADEGRWVTYLLRTNLGGAPEEFRERYIEYSPFVHGVPDGGNAAILRDLPVRAYHEPDVDWWIKNRRKSYYSMNSIDLAALINQLLILGNDNAELITTHGRRAGYAEGSSPHTWSMVDDAEFADWMLRLAGD